MRLNKTFGIVLALIASVALLLGVAGVAYGATKSASSNAVSAAPAASKCSYHQSGSHWVCITPGAFCPAAAHRHYGLDKYNLSRKYWCENNNGWRWEPNK